MPHRSFTLYGCLLIVSVLGCAKAHERSASRTDNALESSTRQADRLGATAIADDPLVQFSILAALMAGDYDGTVTMTDVLAAGDFGLGTFDRLDGEMILLDGQVYQALADGRVRPADPQQRTPFACVTFFQPDGRLADLSAATLDDLDSRLDRHLRQHSRPYALRIDGEMTELTLRSVASQTPPYRSLVAVAAQQQTFRHANIRGTLLGVRCPDWLGILNVAGYHWHFLSDDRTVGGHVLQCRFDHATLTYDQCSSVVIRIPEGPGFERLNLTEVLPSDIDRVERMRPQQ